MHDLTISYDHLLDGEYTSKLMERIQVATFPTDVKFCGDSSRALPESILSALKQALPAVVKRARVDCSQSTEVLGVLETCKRFDSLQIRVWRRDVESARRNMGDFLSKLQDRLTNLYIYDYKSRVFKDWAPLKHRFTNLKQFSCCSSVYWNPNNVWFSSYLTGALGDKLEVLFFNMSVVPQRYDDGYTKELTRVLSKTKNLVVLVIQGGFNVKLDSDVPYTADDTPNYSAEDETTVAANFALADVIKSLPRLQYLEVGISDAREYGNFVSRMLGPSLRHLDCSDYGPQSNNKWKELKRIAETCNVRGPPMLKFVDFPYALTSGTFEDFRPLYDHPVTLTYTFGIHDEDVNGRVKAARKRYLARLPYLHINAELKRGKQIPELTLKDFLVNHIDGESSEEEEEEEEEEESTWDLEKFNEPGFDPPSSPPWPAYMADMFE